MKENARYSNEKFGKKHVNEKMHGIQMEMLELNWNQKKMHGYHETGKMHVIQK